MSMSATFPPAKTSSRFTSPVAELRRRGVKIVAEPFDPPAIGRRLAFFADPWGNLFELAQVIS